jgi:ABC-type glycerol-3-phosphate transport system substrate-binding protein
MASLRGFLLPIGALALIGVALWGEDVVKRKPFNGRIPVVYWEKWTGAEGEEMRKVVDKFNASQDRIFVKYLSISAVNDKTLLASSGGVPPDVAGIWDGQVAQFSDAGALIDMKQMFDEAGMKREDYIPGYWDMVFYKDSLFALPSTPSSTAMHVNVGMMPEKYKKPENFPKTIEELDELVNEISKKKPDGRLLLAGYLPQEPGWWNYGWGYIFGGKLMDGNKLTIDSPENIRAYEWVGSFSKRFGTRETQTFQSGFGNFSSPQNAFLDGKVAAVQQGVWMANYIQLYNNKMKWYAVPFPYPKDRPDLANQTFLGLDVLTIPKGAKHPKEAFEFIRFVQRQDIMEGLCMGHGKNSPLAHVTDHFLRDHMNPYIGLFNDLARSKNAVAPIKVGFWAQLSAEVINAMQQVNLGQKSAKDALKETQARMVGIQEVYNRQYGGQK